VSEKHSQDDWVPASDRVLLRAEDVVVDFKSSRSLADFVFRRPAPRLRAVDGVSLTIDRHETVGLVGESGSGKTTLARALLRFYDIESGRVELEGRDITHSSQRQLRPLRRRAQMVFQDPYSSLNPRFTVRHTLSEVLRFHRICPPSEIEAEVARLMGLVGLPMPAAASYPSALSGGQRQRVGLARALAVRPDFLVLDEPVAALDMSIQAQVLNLLKDLRDELGLTMLFVAHELSVVRHMSMRIAVMYLGNIVEIGPSEEIFRNPRHPYTQGLLKSVPRLIPERRHRDPVLQGEVPSPRNPPPGCRFHTRCPIAQEICRVEAPPHLVVSGGHTAKCHFALTPATDPAPAVEADSGSRSRSQASAPAQADRPARTD
jgi:oligopeptide/dipeptide ABC transporter ATP-binding protein